MSMPIEVDQNLPQPTTAFAWTPEDWAIITAHPAYAELSLLYAALKAAEEAEAAAKAATRAALKARDDLDRELDGAVDWSKVNTLAREKQVAWEVYYTARRRAQLARLRIPVDPQEVAPLEAAETAAKATAQVADAAHKAERDVRQDEAEALREQAQAAAGHPRKAYVAAVEAHNAARVEVNRAYMAYTDALTSSPLGDFIAWP